mgnify:CR=1 FL=1
MTKVTVWYFALTELYGLKLQTLKGLTMKKNMGNADRIIRFMVAALIAILYFTNLINGTAAVILGIIAIIFSSGLKLIKFTENGFDVIDYKQILREEKINTIMK